MRFLPDPGIRDGDSQILLDAKDKILLRELSVNARQSIAQLSRRAKLSRDVVVYRLSQYKKNNLVFNARMLVDVSALGYDSYHIFMRLSTPYVHSRSDAKIDFIKQLCVHPNVRAVLRFYGHFDLEIAVIAKSIQQFDDILLELLAIVQPHLQEYEVVVITQNIVAHSFPKSFVSQKSELSQIQKKVEADLDEMDYSIIREMRDYADRPLVTIATAVGISTDVLLYRLRKLESSVVLGYSPVINYGAIGYQITAVLCAVSGMTLQKQHMISELLRESPHILWAVKILGRFNLLFYVCAKTQLEYHQTINKLRDVLGDELRSIESLSAVAEYKYTLIPDIIVSDNKKIKK